ncbi:MAG: tyrosine-type recombinase/integrase [Sphingomonas sp.]|nr:tyrosine-type recombinase/integrase [Sphingomonas sp.]
MRKPTPRSLPRWVVRKKSKGRVYFYFITGTVNALGRPILRRLPDISDPGFASALAGCMAARTRRSRPEPMLLVPAMIALYLGSPAFEKKAPATKSLYQLYLNHFADQLATAPAADVRPGDVALLFDKMAITRTEKVNGRMVKRGGTGAANMMLRAIGALYAWARKRGHVPKDCNPVEHIDQFAQDPHAPWPQYILAAALAADDERVRVSAALLYFTAQRIGDVCRLRWTDIREGVIELRQQKTGIELKIRVHRELAAILDALPRRGFTVLSQPNGRAYAVGSVRMLLQGFAAEHGAKVVPHGLRKNAVNAMLENECSAAETAAITGQSLQMVEHYARDRDQKKLGEGAILKWENGR